MPTKNVTVELPEKLREVFTGPARYRGARGGRGGGKTDGFAKMAVIELMLPTPKPWKFLFCRELQKSLKDSVFSVVAQEIANLGVEDAFEVGREYIRCKNGNETLFYGLRSNIAEVKGLKNVRRAWIDESQTVSDSSLLYLVPTVMRDFPDCEIWATWNPDDEDDPIEKMFRDTDETFRVATINWRDNPWFPASLNEVRLLDLKKRPERYDWIWEGHYNINAEGAVYAKWLNQVEQEGRFKACYDPKLPVHTAWDLGYSDYTAIWFYQIWNGEIRVIDYYEAHLQGVRHYAEQITGYHFIVNGMTERGEPLYKRGAPIPDLAYRRAYRYGNHWGPHDAANKLMAAGGRSIIDQLDDFGIKMFNKSAVNQQTQIQMGREAITQAWFDPIRCRDGLRALRKYQYELNDDTQRYSTIPRHDMASHGADAWEILAQSRQSPIIPREPARPDFSHLLKDDLFGAPPKIFKDERI